MSTLKLLLPFFGLLLATCSTPESATPNGPFPPLPSIDTTFTYLALGDSYTIGESVAEGGRYPVQLADSLQQLHRTTLDIVDIVARTGWTTDELDAGIDAREDLEDTYDLVSLLIGVNNQFRGRAVEDYEPEFRALLERAIDFAGGEKDRVFVVSIPDYAYTPFGQGNPAISNGIDIYNAANRAITEEFGIRYFDITPISREGLDNTALVAADNLHPSAEQYGRWVSLMHAEVAEMLGE